MKRRYTIIFVLVFIKSISFSQNITCPSPYIYMDGSAFIRVYNPSLPPSATNPSNTNIPTLTNGGGLTLMSNINGGTVCPTFYSVAGGNYFYWNGVTWVNTTCYRKWSCC